VTLETVVAVEEIYVLLREIPLAQLPSSATLERSRAPGAIEH